MELFVVILSLFTLSILFVIMGVIGNSLRFLFRGVLAVSGWIFYLLWRGFMFLLFLIIFTFVLFFLLKGCMNAKSATETPSIQKQKVTVFDPPIPYDPFYNPHTEKQKYSGKE